MTPEEVALLFSPDLNLSPGARALVAHVSSLGEAEIPYARIHRLLQVSDDKKLRRIIGEAEDAGWVAVQRQTGQGHHPRFTYTPPKNDTLSGDTPSENTTLSPTVVGSKKDGIDPLSPPAEHPLSVKAMQAISEAGEKLEGCRGALVDYLHARVPEPRQYAYVQSVVSWIDNPKQVFQQEDGSPVPNTERVKLLAVALNEMAASDESGYKAPVGDVRNVKNKLFSLARSFGRKATGTDGKRARASPRDQPADANEYDTDKHRWRGELNG